jgi:hypothetical protein
LATASDDKSSIIWDAEKGVAVTTLKVIPYDIKYIATLGDFHLDMIMKKGDGDLLPKEMLFFFNFLIQLSTRINSLQFRCTLD